MRWLRDTPYKPIAAYGVIGDTRAAALVGRDGSIDWCCFPRFDSPSTFAAILDHDVGGRFRIMPTADYTADQRYHPFTNILVTSFHLHDGSGVAEVLDFMPAPGDLEIVAEHQIHRRIRGVRGRIEMEILLEPRFDYARADTRVEIHEHGIIARSAVETLTVSAAQGVRWELAADGRSVRAVVSVETAEDLWIVLCYDGEQVHTVDSYQSTQQLARTATFWNEWAGKLTYQGLYRAEVERSALALKLLFYAPTGAVVAAATTALPETLGGIRNWDYRYCWLRDAAFTLSAFHIVGLYDEAERFIRYLLWVAGKSGDPLQIMYGIGGETDLTEEELPHLSGYRDSAPVRIGNGAHSQLQLDIYGELLAAVHLWHRREMVDNDFWALLVEIVDWVAENWQLPDSSIWEVRAEPRHYVYSKVMCWVALDRAIRMAADLGAPPNLARWEDARAAIHRDVIEHGWNEEKQAFVQYYGGESLDAANLLLPVVGFLPGDDPRVVGTIRATLRELSRDGMLYRYTSDDGLPGEEGVFSICTFWLADALILSGDLENGERVFRRMLRFANHVGLYSEQIDTRTGDFLGNFPQAFTHIALINTAQLLEEAHAARRSALRAQQPD